MASEEELVVMAHGIDKARRIGWARYYMAKGDNEKLLRLNAVLQERLAVMLLLIAEATPAAMLRLHSEAVRTLAILQRTKRGQQALGRARAKLEQVTVNGR